MGEERKESQCRKSDSVRDGCERRSEVVQVKRSLMTSVDKGKLSKQRERAGQSTYLIELMLNMAWIFRRVSGVSSCASCGSCGVENDELLCRWTFGCVYDEIVMSCLFIQAVVSVSSVSEHCFCPADRSRQRGCSAQKSGNALPVVVRP